MVACFQHYGCVVDVFDRYDKKDSTKSAERERRSSSNPGKVFQIIEGRSSELARFVKVWYFVVFCLRIL
jgi:hypothetical protein